MEFRFEKRMLPFLKCVLSEVQNMEQTQELRIGNDMPEIGRVICGWGQTVLRSREWKDTGISISAGMMVWVLYEAEDGSGVQCVETWIPFSLHWEFPERYPEGVFTVNCLTRFVDVRSVSAGKLLIRAGISARVQAFVQESAELSVPESDPEPVQLLRSEYPVRLLREAGEKHFSMEETLTIPPSAPIPEKILSFRMEPKVSDSRVLAEKLVFRGNENLHVLYLSEEGRVCSWDFELPFSQFAELPQSLSQDAQASFVPAITNVELSVDDQGAFRLRSGLAAQYLITDLHTVSIAEDAACPGRELKIHTQLLSLPEILDTRIEMITAETSMAARADIVADAQMMPEFPGMSRQGEEMVLRPCGQIQVLYYDTENHLQCVSGSWEGSQTLKLHEDAKLYAQPDSSWNVQAIPGPDRLEVRCQLPVQLTSEGGQGIPMITQLELGEQTRPDPDRPSLILCRMGKERLWDLAKRSGSTVGDIREINSLQTEPEAGTLLLIPVK